MKTFTIVNSRFGELLVVSEGSPVKKIYLPGSRVQKLLSREFPGIKKVNTPEKGLCPALAEYLDGKKIKLSLAGLDLSSLNAFRKSVLLALAAVPRGKVISYSALAAKAGSPGAARAAGTVMAQNPFPIAIPCHRTVRSDGTLGGFGGGLKMKRALLEMEGVEFDEKGRGKEGFFCK
jgi:methylated-DNA-[protein]-cysteine S-methyltransferase